MSRDLRTDKLDETLTHAQEFLTGLLTYYGFVSFSSNFFCTSLPGRQMAALQEYVDSLFTIQVDNFKVCQRLLYHPQGVMAESPFMLYLASFNPSKLACFNLSISMSIKFVLL
ncbi:hypothetical protein OUZ56_022525 [Daphnia magna]|uniref:Uncharacterized protein n=1 Tax=Daphnia magna TaxID=35525 RepID=A0ABR0AWP5_9CRUS|nr:hypothetical protein OUZ56_022525 [Daphnia magna]